MYSNVIYPAGSVIPKEIVPPVKSESTSMVVTANPVPINALCANKTIKMYVPFALSEKEEIPILQTIVNVFQDTMMMGSIQIVRNAIMIDAKCVMIMEIAMSVWILSLYLLYVRKSKIKDNFLCR